MTATGLLQPRAIYHSNRLVRRILMRPLRTLADTWLVRCLSFSSTECYCHASAMSHTAFDSFRPADCNETLADSIRPLAAELSQLLVRFLGAIVVSEPALLLAPGMPLLRVLLVHTTSLYIVLFYSLNNAILLSDPLLTLVLSVKCPTSTKYPLESMQIFPLLLPRKSS